MSRPEAFPWTTTGEGLCKALRDPMLWGPAFKEPEFRKDIVWLAGKKSRLVPTSMFNREAMSDPSDRTVGDALVELLADSEKRRRLKNRLKQGLKRSKLNWYEYIAQKLFNHVSSSHKDIFPELPEVCDKREHRFFLDINKFAGWLAGTKIPSEHAHAMALFACAFAILQPGEAQRILQTVLNSDEGLAPWLLEDVAQLRDLRQADTTSRHEIGPSAATALLPESSSSLPTSSSGSVTEAVVDSNAAEVSGSLPAESAELLRVLNDGVDWTRDLPLENYRADADALHEKANEFQRRHGQFLKASETLTDVLKHTDAHGDSIEYASQGPESHLSTVMAIERLAAVDGELRSLFRERIDLAAVVFQHLRQKLERIQERLQQFDETHRRVRTQLEEMARMPWLETPLTVEGCLEIASNDCLANAQARLDTVAREVARLRQTHFELERVLGLLNEQPSAFVPKTVSQLSEVASHLEQRLADRRTRLHEIGSRERNVADFFERFSALTDQHGGPCLLEETTPQRWEDIVHFLVGPQPCTDAGKKYRFMLERYDIVGALVAHLWPHHAPLAQKLVTSALLSRPTPSSRKDRIDVLGLLDFGQLQQLVASQSAVAPFVIELIYATAFCNNQPSVLAYLEPLLDATSVGATCVELCRATLDAWLTGSLADPFQQLRAWLSEAFEETPSNHAEQQRQRVLDLIHHRPPTEGKYYRKLHAAARTQYYAEVESAIQSDNADAAWTRWASLGTLDQKVEQCVSSVGHRWELQSAHLSQTRRHLENFETELRQWCQVKSRPTRDGDVRVRQAISTLRRESESGRSPSSASFLDTLNTLYKQPRHQSLPPPDFGQRCLVDKNGESLLVASASSVLRPELTWSWPLAITRGAVPIKMVLCDLLRQALGTGPTSVSDAVQEYIDIGAFPVALRAAQGHPVLEQKVASVITTRTRELHAAHVSLLEMAQKCRAHDGDINEYLQEVQTSFDEAQFTNAIDLLKDLDVLVQQFQAKRDPVRLALLEYLHEGGCSLAEDTQIERLERQVQELRSQNEVRRLHIAQLEHTAGIELVPTSIRNRWGNLAKNIDRPALWPDGETSFLLASAIETFSRFLIGQTRYRDTDPAMADLFADRFADWLPEQFSSDPTLRLTDNSSPLSRITQLADEIADRCPDRRVLQLLGVSETSETRLPTMPTGKVQPAFRVVGGDVVRRVPEAHLDSTEVLSGVRAFLGERISKEVMRPDADERKLLLAVRNSDWHSVREIAATLCRRLEIDDSDASIHDAEAVYGVALAYSAETEDANLCPEAFKNGSLALLMADKSRYHFYLEPALHPDHELVVRGLAAATGLHPQGSLPSSSLSQVLGQALSILVDQAHTEPAFQWFNELSWKASRFGPKASARLGLQLWDALKGMESVDEPRAALLKLLFRLRRKDALEHLTKQAEPLDDVALICLNAFDRAEDDPATRPQALELLVTLREQSYRKKNTKPWINLFQHLVDARAESTGPAVESALESDFLARQPDGTALLEVRLTPSQSDPPRTLQLEFAGVVGSVSTSRTNLLPDDEALLHETVVPVRVPASALTIVGDVVQISYRITGQTVLKKGIDIRSLWTLPNVERTLAELPRHDILSGWPGATGDPVESSAFHGRKREIDEIESYLQANDRQRSVMVFGQRRIGKTSLLKKLVESYPPHAGALCAVFVDVSSCPAPPGEGGMAKAFFEFFVSKLQNEPLNQAFRTALENQAGQRVEIETLTRGLRPEVALEDALEALLERLENTSRGLIARIVLFVDEFDRYVEPLLQGRREDVIKLHASFRQIIQRSRRLSLVLAGSGLQRVFTTDYLHPFYGSIAEVELAPFEWQRDQDAIYRTFLPARLREVLCPGSRVEPVIRRAYELSGGHPYFLSMLGYSAALVSRGHPLTPALLNRVADLMVQNKVGAVGCDITRKKFYAFIDESLKRLPARDQVVCRLVLATLARLTSTEYQSWKKWDLFQDPEMMVITTSDERLGALKNLEQERVIEFDKGRSQVRIRVPLTAAAIREDAVAIRQEAVRQLKLMGGGTTR